MAIESTLDAEIQYRKKLGQTELPLSKFEEALRAIGYRFDRRMDCRAPARYMTGDRAGESYPSLSLKPVQTDNGMAWSHVDSRRDSNWHALLNLRQTTFSVVNGAIAEF